MILLKEDAKTRIQRTRIFSYCCSGVYWIVRSKTISLIVAASFSPMQVSHISSVLASLSLYRLRRVFLAKVASTKPVVEVGQTLVDAAERATFCQGLEDTREGVHFSGISNNESSDICGGYYSSVSIGGSWRSISPPSADQEP